MGSILTNVIIFMQIVAEIFVVESTKWLRVNVEVV